MNITNKLKILLRKGEKKIVILKEEHFLDLLDESRTGVIDNIRCTKKGVEEFTLMINLLPEVRKVIIKRK